MNWVNLRTELLRAPEYIGSEPVERATWLNLLAYCCEQENGGVLAGCRSWKDRMWQQAAGVTMEEVGAESDLWKWEGDTLILWGYPHEKEQEVRAKREAGRKGGKRSGNTRKAQSEARRKTPDEAVLQAELGGQLERKGMEGKGKEEEGNPRGGAEDSLSDLPSAEDLNDLAVAVEAIQGLHASWGGLSKQMAIAEALRMASPPGRGKAVRDFILELLVLDELPKDFPLGRLRGYMRNSEEKKDGAAGSELPKRFEQI